jgi:hypothetical protein
MTKPFTTFAIFIFAVMALIHVLRLLFGWEVTINGVVIPMWASVIGAIIAGILAVMVKREA